MYFNLKKKTLAMVGLNCDCQYFNNNNKNKCDLKTKTKREKCPCSMSNQNNNKTLCYLNFLFSFIRLQIVFYSKFMNTLKINRNKTNN